MTFLIFFFGLSASSCAKKVKHVAIVPGAVTVVAGESFALSLELRNGDGELINCCDAEYSPNWEIVESDAPLSYWKSNLKAHVSIWESVTGVYHIKATVNGHSDQMELTIVAGSPQYAPLAYVAQDSRIQSGTCEPGWFVEAFVGLELVKESVDGCSSKFAVFAEGHSVAYWSAPTGLKLASGSVEWQPPEPIKIPLAVWVLDDGYGSPAINSFGVTEDLNGASALLARQWAGVGIDVPNSQVKFEGTDFDLEQPIVVCPSIEIPGQPFAQQRMNVYYMPWSGSFGLSCSELIFLTSNSPVSAAVLAHELGHSMSLVYPNAGFRGHANSSTWGVLTGFGRDNLMWSDVSAHDPSHPTGLTFGQVFRMNIDSRSWLNNPNACALTGGPLRPLPRKTETCSWDPYDDGACPRLALKMEETESGGSLPGGYQNGNGQVGSALTTANCGPS